METMNGGQGGEDARQIAPGVARSDYRAGWAIVVIALVFLFCPGCGEGEGAESFAVMVLIGAALAGWVARSILAGRELRERDSAERTLTAERDFALQAKAQAFEESQRQIADLKSKLETAHLIAFPLCESYERLFLLVGLSKDDLIDNDPEGMEAMLTQRIERLIAAADACAELLSGPNAPGEHTAARVALRATGRLGGPRADAAEPKAEPATLCRCGHTNGAHAFVAGVRAGRCLGFGVGGYPCGCNAIDVVAQAAGSGS